MIELICNQCERINKQSATHCDRCGAPLAAKQEEPAAEDAASSISAADDEQTAPDLHQVDASQDESSSQHSVDDTTSASAENEDAQPEDAEESGDQKAATQSTVAAANAPQSIDGDDANKPELAATVTAEPGIGHGLAPLQLLQRHADDTASVSAETEDTQPEDAGERGGQQATTASAGTAANAPQPAEGDDANKPQLAALALAEPGLGHRLVPPLLAAVCTAALYFIAAGAPGSGAALQSLLLPSGGWLQSTIPMAIAFLFLWSFAILALRFIVTQKQRGFVHAELVQSCARRVRDGQLAEVIESVHAELQQNRSSIIYGTVYALLHTLSLTNDPQRSHAYLRDLAHLNATALRLSQRKIRVLIWSMLLLGLLAAVAGASTAVGQYAAVLTAGVESNLLLKTDTGQLFTQLSSAFNTTVLGLAASLLILLTSGFVRSREAGLLTSVQQLCLRIISHARVPEPDRSLEVHVRNWFAELRQTLDSEICQRQAVYDDIAASVSRVGEDISGSISMLEISLGNIKTVLIGELESSLRGVSGDIQRVGQEIAEAAENLPLNIAKAQDTFAGELDSVLGNVASRFEGVGDLISGSYASLPATLDSVQKQFADELKNQVDEQIGGLGHFGTAFNDSVTTLASSLTDMPAQLAGAGQALQESAAQVAQLKASIDAAAISSSEHASAAQLLANKVETLAISSEVTQQAVSSLQSLRALMNEMQEAQAKLAPLINQIAGPHEIRIVPQPQPRMAAEPESAPQPELETEY